MSQLLMIMMLVLDLPPFDFPPPQQIRFILQTTFLSRLCDTHPFGTSLNLLELDEVGETTVVTTYCLIVFFIFAVIVDTRGLRTFFVGAGVYSNGYSIGSAHFRASLPMDIIQLYLLLTSLSSSPLFWNSIFH
jgi:hypothetical protein